MTRDEMLALARKARTSALLAIQNSEGCAVNHFGGDHELHGMPGWLADCRMDVETFFAAFPEMVMALEDRASHTERRYRHTRQWNAERWERITAYAKERGFWNDIACIMANGTLTMSEGVTYDPPTYAQQLNAAIHRAEAAEDRASDLQGQLDNLRASLLSEKGEG